MAVVGWVVVPTVELGREVDGTGVDERVLSSSFAVGETNVVSTVSRTQRHSGHPCEFTNPISCVLKEQAVHVNLFGYGALDLSVCGAKHTQRCECMYSI